MVNAPRRPGSDLLLSRRHLLQGALAAGSLVLAAGCVARRPLEVPVAVPSPFATGVRAALTLPPDTAAQLDAVLKRLTVLQSFSGAALVAHGNRVLLSAGYGWADIEQRIQNRSATRLPIASITKQFTAMAILQLQDRGALHVYDRVAAYLDSAPPAWSAITLHQLLTHTSGIPDYFSLSGYGTLAAAQPTPEQLIAVFRDAPLDFAPGTQWAYCNSDYVLLGHVIERASGLPYADFLQRNIFGPVGMAQTSYDPAPAASATHPTGYTSWGQPAPADDPSTLYAAGGLTSTVGDLFLWHRALSTGTPQLASPGAIRAMFTPYAAADNPGGPHTGQGYGYGWFIDTAVPRRRFWDPGAIDGFTSYAAMYPDNGFSVILLSNLGSNDVRSTGEALAAVLL